MPIESRAERIEIYEPAPKRHSPNLLCYAEMVKLRPPTWRVEDVLPDGGTAVLFGESNAYKSFVAIDLSCSVAVDVSWHGHAVVPGTVIYVASEAANGIATRRIPAWMAHHGIPAEQRRGIFLRPQPPLLDNPATLETFKADIASVGPVGLITYDVLAGTMKGSEKDTDIIAAWVRVVSEIGEAFHCTQLFVTHSPYGDSGRARGGTHLWGSFDTRLRAEGDSDKRTTIISVERHKDADSAGLKWGFNLAVTDIDERPDDTSLVPLLDATVAAKTKTAKLTDTAGEALKSFKYGIAEGAGEKRSSDHIPADAIGMTATLWWLYFGKLASEDVTADTKSKRFKRGVKRLLDLDLVAKWDDFHWLTDAGKAAS